MHPTVKYFHKRYLQTPWLALWSRLREGRLTDTELLYDARRLLESPSFRRKFVGSYAQLTHLALAFIDRAKGAHMQDVWALQESGFKHGGYFVDIGAFDGVDMSNTYLLEKDFGWHGILVEPNPKQHASILANRSAALATECITGKGGETRNFWVTERPEFSSLTAPEELGVRWVQRVGPQKVIDVKTITLNELLERHKAPKNIDFISVDAEGNDLDIISGFDFSAWNVASWCIEKGNAANEAAIDALMERHGYQRRHRGWSVNDAFYVKASAAAAPNAVEAKAPVGA